MVRGLNTARVDVAREIWRDAAKLKFRMGLMQTLVLETYTGSHKGRCFCSCTMNSLRFRRTKSSVLVSDVEDQVGS
jgi:hypothetical protein